MTSALANDDVMRSTALRSKEVAESASTRSARQTPSPAELSVPDGLRKFTAPDSKSTQSCIGCSVPASTQFTKNRTFTKLPWNPP